MDQPDDAGVFEVEITADTSQLVGALQRVQATMMFAWHEDLRGLDDTLDNLYGGAL